MSPCLCSHTFTSPLHGLPFLLPGGPGCIDAGDHLRRTRVEGWKKQLLVGGFACPTPLNKMSSSVGRCWDYSSLFWGKAKMFQTNSQIALYMDLFTSTNNYAAGEQHEIMRHPFAFPPRQPPPIWTLLSKGPCQSTSKLPELRTGHIDYGRLPKSNDGPLGKKMEGRPGTVYCTFHLRWRTFGIKGREERRKTSSQRPHKLGSSMGVLCPLTG